ncbi:transmembrane protein, putative (macronuclear) [Tetrahymena thermophila SB210]|uniref:Transmembrane protein, putative n=1 Tax=Tetrahymena thermophila (strain SB210) TaxID=312017 RepID=W7XGS9_TETTS|nr:transmembrane protein, putative [Tetrahymena thermophila SB210]EWS73421.1 transmembrane protein, putative [Tetrahymena thermophila SB210]|eukprot:XP_012654037.1 transmembrane protein, putative [Tetrahymena thermophila SB210]
MSILQPKTDVYERQYAIKNLTKSQFSLLIQQLAIVNSQKHPIEKAQQINIVLKQRIQNIQKKPYRKNNYQQYLLSFIICSKLIQMIIGYIIKYKRYSNNQQFHQFLSSIIRTAIFILIQLWIVLNDRLKSFYNNYQQINQK